MFDPRKSDAYEQVRRPDHTTLGDAHREYGRDPEAFAAGAQYALDNLLNRTEHCGLIEVPRTAVADFAADVLQRVRDGLSW